VVSASKIKPEMMLLINNTVYKVLAADCRGSAQMAGHAYLKLKNVATGGVEEKSFSADEKLEEADLNKVQMEYLYEDGDNYCFMNTVTFDQALLPKSTIGRASAYMKPNDKIVVEFLGDRPVNIILPEKVPVKVSSTAPAIRGGEGDKSAALENGQEILVPQFIKDGDIILVEVSSGKYLERVKQD
jgi:elongation factor P